ncbi:hypothetical protein MN116_006133 [Schistosoma mekongi]|uniref:Uncharacterized protein n=1 Tax=Schistosoma mekongi TaxID=38744 RepID=A0AAE1ZBD1_SCHME|nr:hypothetical protein MN116_006133 [Schistosoma mekongi]
MSFGSTNLTQFPAMLAAAQTGGPTAFVAINSMFPASPSSLPNSSGTILSMPTNMIPSNISSTPALNPASFLLPPANFSPNPANLTCTVPLSSPPQLQAPILPFFAPTSGNLLPSNSSSLSMPSPFGAPMSHFVHPGHSNSLPTFSSSVSTSGIPSTMPVSLFPSSNQMSSNILPSQPMVLPTLPVAFNNQTQTNSVGVLPISIGMPQSLPSNPITETTTSFLVSSSSYTTPIYTATLFPLNNSAILPVTTVASLPSNLSAVSYLSSVSGDHASTTSIKNEKPLASVPSKVSCVRNLQALEAVDFHRDAILDAIDKLRERKARPDFERISCLLKRHQNINSDQTHLCLQRLADAGAVVCVDYKGNLSYRNPAKWRKTAATSGAGNTNLPSVSHKLIDAIRSLMESNSSSQSTQSCTNLIPYSQPGPNGGYSLFQIERALQFLNADVIDLPKSGPELTGATLRVCLDREATHGKLAKTSDGRYLLDETGEHKKAYMNNNNMHAPQLSNKKLLPPNNSSTAYQTSNGSCFKVTKSGLVDRNIAPTRLHPLAAKQTPNTPNGKPINLSLTPGFLMPPLTAGRRGRPPGTKAKKVSNEVNPCEKKIKVENPLSTYENATITNVTDSNTCNALNSPSLYVSDTSSNSLVSTSCFTSHTGTELHFSSTIPVLPSSSFITVIASSSNNCSNILPGTILPTHFSAASSIPIDSTLMTSISPPFLSFPLSQGLPLPPLFSSTSNLSHDFTNAQLTIPLKPDGMLTPDSFIADMDCGGIDRQEDKDDPVCFCCGGLPTCEEAFLICKDCGLHAHPTCLDYWPELTERARQSPWQCSDCKTCTICNNNEYKGDLIVCDACDKGFHVECHQPKLEESIDRSLPWVCTNCQDEGYRVAIGTLPSSVNHQNYSTPNKIKDSDDSGKTPLKEINSSYEYVKPELKHETDESSCIEENVIKSVESSPYSTTTGHNFETNASNTLCNENIPVDANPTSHPSFVLSPTKSCSRTPSKLNDSTSNNNTNEINSAQLKEESFHEYKSESTKNLADNDNKASSDLRNLASDLHLRSCIDSNDKHGSNNNDTVNTTTNNKEIKNEIGNTNESNTVTSENHEVSLTNNRPIDVSIWSVDHVQHWLLEEGFPREAEAFYQQEIDGTCLLLMKRMDVLTELGIKLGPAVKIYERIKRFQSQCGSPT